MLGPGKRDDNPQSNEEVVEQIGKEDAKTRYLVFSTAELEGVHLKHSVEVSRGQHGRASSHTFPRQSAGWGASLKCLYTNTRSTGNKRDELEICVQSQGRGLTGIRDMMG